MTVAPKGKPKERLKRTTKKQWGKFDGEMRDEGDQDMERDIDLGGHHGPLAPGRVVSEQVQGPLVLAGRQRGGVVG